MPADISLSLQSTRRRYQFEALLKDFEIIIKISLTVSGGVLEMEPAEKVIQLTSVNQKTYVQEDSLPDSQLEQSKKGTMDLFRRNKVEPQSEAEYEFRRERAFLYDARDKAEKLAKEQGEATTRVEVKVGDLQDNALYAVNEFSKTGFSGLLKQCDGSPVVFGDHLISLSGGAADDNKVVREVQSSVSHRGRGKPFIRRGQFSPRYGKSVANNSAEIDVKSDSDDSSIGTPEPKTGGGTALYSSDDENTEGEDKDKNRGSTPDYETAPSGTSSNADGDGGGDGNGNGDRGQQSTGRGQGDGGGNLGGGDNSGQGTGAGDTHTQQSAGASGSGNGQDEEDGGGDRRKREQEKTAPYKTVPSVKEDEESLLRDLNNPCGEYFKQDFEKEKTFRQMQWVTHEVRRWELKNSFYVGVALTNGEAAEMTRERDPITRFTWLGDLKQLMGDITEKSEKWEIFLDPPTSNIRGYRYVWFYGKGYVIHYLLVLLRNWMAPYIKATAEEAPKYPPRRPTGRNFLILRYHVSAKNIMVARNGVFCVKCKGVDHHSGDITCKDYNKRTW